MKFEKYLAIPYLFNKVKFMGDSSFSIFNYMEVSYYLADYYRHRKQVDKMFSYNRWAMELGFKNKTLLRLILQRKRKVSPKSAQLFCYYLKFTDIEQEYFKALIEFSNAQTATQRNAMGARLIQLQKNNFQQATVSPDSGILTDVYGPLVLTVVSSSHEPLQIEPIAKILCLNRDRVKMILEALEKAHLIIKKEGCYKAHQNCYKIGDSFFNANLKRFYQFWLSQSIKAIDYPKEVRRFGSLQMLLNEEEFSDLLNKFADFKLSILNKFENNSTDNRKMYIFNTSLFQLMETVMETKNREDQNSLLETGGATKREMNL